MPALSPCLKLVGKMSDADADDLIARVDSYIEAGVAPAEAQRTATQDILAELEAERAEVVTLATPAPAPSVTDTPAFKRWFGDWQDPTAHSSRYPKDKTPVSMAVNQDGSPLRLFHATNSDFTVFEPGRPTVNNTTFGPIETERHAIFATPDVKFAEEYFKGKDGATVMPVYMNIKSPADLRDGLPGEFIADIVENSDLRRNDFYYITPSSIWEIFDGDFGAQVVAAMRKAGYDGAIIKELNNERDTEHDVWVALDPVQVKSATGNTGTFDGTNPDIRFSQPEPQAGPGFYSALRRELANAKTNASPSEYWTNLIKGAVNKGAVKKDEVQWSGVEAWLASQDGKVKKADVLAWLDENGVRVEEAVLGEPRDIAEVLTRDLAGTGFTADYDPNVEEMSFSDEDGEYTDYEDLPADVQAIVDRRRSTGYGNEGTKYGKYVLPGGTNYTERLLKLPSKVEQTPFQYMVGYTTGTVTPFDTREAAERFRDDVMRGANIYEEPRSKWTSTNASKDYHSNHWAGHPNVIGHIRLNDRVDATGAKVLMVEELQSDMGQDTKKQRDAIQKAVDNDFEGIVSRMKKAGVLEVVCD